MNLSGPTRTGGVGLSGTDQRALFPGLHSFHPPRPGEKRIGVVDVGSNSVRLVVYDGGARCPAVVFNEKVICGLGQGLAETGKLNPEGCDRALAALHRFALLAVQLGVDALSGIATAALREAEDGRAFRDRIAAATNIQLDIASGVDEARIAAQGVLFGNPRAEGVVADLGGASMELCRIGGGTTGHGVSTMLGPLSLADMVDDDRRLRAHVSEVLDPLADDFRMEGGTLHLVGGAWRALARVAMDRAGYPMRLVHEYRMSSIAAAEAAHWVQVAGAEAISALSNVSTQRINAMPITGTLLEMLIERLTPVDVMISAFGLREGLCYEYLPEHLRMLDPMLATCQRQERNRSRAPGFGADLALWVAPVMPPEAGEDPRLIPSACHLADVCWRAHPEYRDVSCLEAATRLNLSSAGHEGRAFLGAALIARYRSNRKSRPRDPMLGLLSEEQAMRAKQLGALMRLGCTVAGATPGILGLAPIRVEGGVLVLTLDRSIRTLMGEEVRKRLSQAAKALGLDNHVDCPE